MNELYEEVEVEESVEFEKYEELAELEEELDHEFYLRFVLRSPFDE